MKKLIITALIAIASFNVNAQNKPVADETNIVQLKTSFKVVTSNQKIIDLLLADKELNVLKWSVSVKQDRLGSYKEYVISFKNELMSKVQSFFTKINK